MTRRLLLLVSVLFGIGLATGTWAAGEACGKSKRTGMPSCAEVTKSSADFEMDWRVQNDCNFAILANVDVANGRDWKIEVQPGDVESSEVDIMPWVWIRSIECCSVSGDSFYCSDPCAYMDEEEGDGFTCD